METELNYDTLDETYFDEIADRLLNECQLVVNGKAFRLVEIEFYLKTAHHNDEYTHCDADQLLMHTFYFHKFKTGTYKAGTFKGMDLTFGDADEEAYFGILVRAIQDIEHNTIIEGPCKVVDRILLEYGHQNIAALTDYQSLNIFENEKQFILEVNEDLEHETISAGPRIGLSNKYPEFRHRSYRYVIFRNRIKKEKTKLKDLDNQ